LLEVVLYVVGLASLGLGWYFNVRYTHLYGHKASYVNYTKSLFSNWASDSAAQDYIIVNLVLLPLWTIVDGRRRGLKIPWIFFVMSLFTSLAFSMAMFLAFVERQIRYNRAEVSASSTA
jgi:Terpene cyclase DEP1